MPKNGNGDRRRKVVSGASIVMGAAGIIAGVAAAEHVHARHENRESVVEGVGRWIRQRVTDASGSTSSTNHGSRAGTRAMPTPLPRPLTRPEVNALPVRRVPENVAITENVPVDGAPTFMARPGQVNAPQVRALPSDVDPTVNSSKPSGNECSVCVVCREQYIPGDIVLRLPCFHEFHGECIRDYLETAQGPVCPVCRYPVLVSHR